jgi:hypothetical protein
LNTLQVVAGPVKPSLTIRAWHRFQERLRPPRARRVLARAVARFRPQGRFEPLAEDRTLQADGVLLMPAFLPRQAAEELRRLLESYECVDPWKPDAGKFSWRAAPPNTHVADIPAAPTIATLHDLALDPRLVRLATAYFGCRPYLDSIQAWWSLSGNEAPEEAENFHRDNDSIRFLKFFLYLTDVGHEHGPHNFVVGSHRDGKLLERRRLTDGEVERAFGGERIRSIIGSAGDAFMEDTWGIHKGQLPRAGYRLLAQFRYSIMPTVFRSPLIVRPLRDYDRSSVTSLLYER